MHLNMVPGAWRFLRRKYNPLPSSPFEMRLLQGDEEVAAALTVPTASVNAGTAVVARWAPRGEPRARRKGHQTLENAILRCRSMSAFSRSQDPFLKHWKQTLRTRWVTRSNKYRARAELLPS
jgi:hypothetical protein